MDNPLVATAAYAVVGFSAVCSAIIGYLLLVTICGKTYDWNSKRRERALRYRAKLRRQG